MALTAYAMKEDEAKALAAGCQAYVAKPINTRSVPETIFQLLDPSVVPPGRQP